MTEQQPISLPEPHNLEAEQAVLGAMLFDNHVWRDLRDILPAEDFCDPLHQRMMEAIGELVGADGLADANTLTEKLRGSRAFEDLGGVVYLFDMIDRAPPSGHAQTYAAIISDLALKRRLAAIGTVAKLKSLDPEITGYDAIAEVRQTLEAIEHGAAPDDGLFSDARTVGEGLLGKVEAELATGRPRGLPCGLECVDKRLGGLLPGSLVIIAGRPGMAKTATMGNIMAGAANLNPGHLFAALSLEMDNDQLVERALSRLTANDIDPIPYERIGKRTVVPTDMLRLHELKQVLPRNLLLRDRAGVGLEEIRRGVWVLKRRGPLGAIAIDYLQLMKQSRRDGRNTAEVIGDTTKGLKNLARDAGIAIVLLSQLSRAVEMRDDKRPQLSDLRDSGSIEQDADAVLFPFREAYYLQKNEPADPSSDAYITWSSEMAKHRDRMDVIIGKNRHGSEGVAVQSYKPELDLITNREHRF